MRRLLTIIKPSRGYSHTFYYVFNILLPFLVLAFVKIELAWLALGIILLSKWRMFAVRPRFWLANVRANAVDVIIGLSALAFVIDSSSTWMQLLWVALWVIWLIYIKPATDTLWVSLQAFVGLVAGLIALFVIWDSGPLVGLVLAAGAICFFAAHHFFDGFEEPHSRLLALLWGYFGAGLTWILSHWLLFYGPVAQSALILSALGFGIGTIYYLDHFDKLSVNTKRQFIFIMIAVVLLILAYSDWSNKVVGGGV
ncbi:MAG: hypothetical protein ABI220_05715 [Candidatus Saccharimonadales bacterium]